MPRLGKRREEARMQGDPQRDARQYRKSTASVERGRNDADGLRSSFTEWGHFDSRFIMKYTSGSTAGSAMTIAAIDMSTSSRRR